MRWQISTADIVCSDGVTLEEAHFIIARWMLDNCAEFDDCNGADLNSDGEVNLTDFVILAADWLRNS